MEEWLEAQSSGEYSRWARRLRSDQEENLKDLGFVGRNDNVDDDEENRIERTETEGVFVIKEGFVKFMPVEIGIAGEEDFEVITGLEADQEIVTGPFRVLRELKDGALVKIKSDKKKRGSGSGNSDD